MVTLMDFMNEFLGIDTHELATIEPTLAGMNPLTKLNALKYIGH